MPPITPSTSVAAQHPRLRLLLFAHHQNDAVAPKSSFAIPLLGHATPDDTDPSLGVTGSRIIGYPTSTVTGVVGEKSTGENGKVSSLDSKADDADNDCQRIAVTIAWAVACADSRGEPVGFAVLTPFVFIGAGLCRLLQLSYQNTKSLFRSSVEDINTHDEGQDETVDGGTTYRACRDSTLNLEAKGREANLSNLKP
ncbi:hypothetical protein E6O75_ATG01586 [Venturia nashicola]|uniref:Uncharacterized protein n=1 Tax=Venturia nashicola TaxID=86259 RepID=A0A4Z1PF82_9PEZI|nr:hypothetical protein E6O75_ATG01586 [Venturia nashicola]